MKKKKEEKKRVNLNRRRKKMMRKRREKPRKRRNLKKKMKSWIKKFKFVIILWILIPKKLPFTTTKVCQDQPLSASTVTTKKFDCDEEEKKSALRKCVCRCSSVTKMCLYNCPYGQHCICLKVPTESCKSLMCCTETPIKP